MPNFIIFHIILEYLIYETVYSHFFSYFWHKHAPKKLSDTFIFLWQNSMYLNRHSTSFSFKQQFSSNTKQIYYFILEDVTCDTWFFASSTLVVSHDPWLQTIRTLTLVMELGMSIFFWINSPMSCFLKCVLAHGFRPHLNRTTYKSNW